MESIQAPLVLEDFEVGDRFYLQYLDRVTLGTVISVYNGVLTVLFDNGQSGYFPADEIRNPSQGNFGKPLDLQHLEAGSVISCLKDGERIYADVLVFEPGERLAYRINGQGAIAVVMESEHRPNLEKQMIEWEIEE